MQVPTCKIHNTNMKLVEMFHKEKLLGYTWLCIYDECNEKEIYNGPVPQIEIEIEPVIEEIRSGNAGTSDAGPPAGNASTGGIGSKQLELFEKEN